MQHIDIKSLILFLTLMKFRSVRHTAIALGRHEASVVYGIKKLERSVESKLFTRISTWHGPVLPTPRAVALAPLISQMLTIWSELMSQPAAEDFPETKVKRNLRIGFPTVLGDPAVATILAHLIHLLGEYNIIVSQVNETEGVDAIRSGKLDCACTIGDVGVSPGVQADHLFLTERCIVARPRAEKAVFHWVLLADDTAPGCPIQSYLGGLDRSIHRMVLPSWAAQLHFWRASGGCMPTLRFNAPFLGDAAESCFMPVPVGFPEWASVSLIHARDAEKPWLANVHKVVGDVLRDLSSWMPTAEIDVAVDEPLTRSGLLPFADTVRAAFGRT